MKLYIIGGSPCSGKSTVAEAIAARWGLTYFKVDDHLDRYLQKAAEEGKPACAAVQGMSPEQIWMRDAHEQCREELKIYEEIFGYVWQDIASLDAPEGIITEGAAYLPSLVKQLGIPPEKYLSITPAKAFQLHHYSKREWVPYVLAGCSNQEKAFANWMERDALFAVAVQQQCDRCGYRSVINDGSLSPEDLIQLTAAHFALL